jgi:hypothetical protein
LSPTHAHPASYMRWPLEGKAAAAAIFSQSGLVAAFGPTKNAKLGLGPRSGDWLRCTGAPTFGRRARQGVPAQVLPLGAPPGAGLAPGERHGRCRNHRSDDIVSHNAPPHPEAAARQSNHVALSNRSTGWTENDRQTIKRLDPARTAGASRLQGTGCSCLGGGRAIDCRPLARYCFQTIGLPDNRLPSWADPAPIHSRVRLEFFPFPASS